MNNIVIKTCIKLKELLPINFKLKGLFAVLLLLTNSIFELIGLASIIPLLTVIVKDGIIQQNKYLKYFYEIFEFSSENSFIITIAGCVVILILIKNIIGIMIQKYQTKFALDLMSYCILKLHNHYYQKGFLYFKETSSVLINRDIFTVPQRFAQIVVVNIFNLFHELIILILIISSIIIYDSFIVLILSFTVLPIFFFSYRITKNKIKTLGHNFNDILPKIANNIYQSVFGYVDVIINGTYKFFLKRIKDKMSIFKNISIWLIIFKLIPSRIIEVSVVLSIFVIIVYGLTYINSKEELLGLLGVYTIASYRIMPSINRVMISLNGITENQYTLDVIEQLLTRKNFTKNESNSIYFNNEISLNNLTYKYPNSNKSVFEKLNYNIKKGEIIGIKGVSGGGKTTLMNLVLGFLSPTSGSIEIDGNELSLKNINSWQKKIGYVQQEVYLLDSSIAENIAFGIDFDEIDFDKVNLVIKQAKIDDFIKNLEYGIKTIVGERGANLSGGQRQRIGIARALYFDSEVLFFDEITSALDPETENEINKTIKKIAFARGITVFMITHKELSLGFFDNIIKL